MTEITFNVALWAAVSSTQQAASDKVSLEEQLARSRAVCAARQWRTVAELVVPGHSREYASLDAAVRDIPELARLMQLARDGQINLLLLYDTNRFRGLQAPIIKTLAAYGVQTYSLSQPLEPADPTKFRYFHSDTQTIMTHVGSLLSDVELAALRRRYDLGMPKRVDKMGLHYNNRLPFGYRRPAGRELDPHAVAEPKPALVPILREMKHRYLELGHSAGQIAAWLEAEHIPTERGHPWSLHQVLYVLTNPFYAGLVARGQGTMRRDLMTGKRIHKRRPRSEWTLAPGRHQAVWSVEDYERIVARRNSRARGLGRVTHVYAFSRLLVCAQCGAHLRWGDPVYAERPAGSRISLGKNGSARELTVPEGGFRVYRCVSGNSKAGHGRIFETQLVDELHAFLTRWLSGPLPKTASASPHEPDLAGLRTDIAANDAARARYQRLYGRGGMSDAEYDARMAELAAERTALDGRLDTAGSAERSAERLRNVRSDAADLLANWDALWQLPGQEINARLGRIVARIVVSGRTITEIVTQA